MPEPIRQPIVVAVVQSRVDPYYDLPAALEILRSGVAEAAAQGARIVACGETFLPGYPVWLDHCPEMGFWNHEPTKEVFARLRRNSVTVPGPATASLGDLAREHRVVLIVGVNERVDRGPGNGTLYNSLLTFGPDGRLLNHHRKLVPTYTERLVWGHGDSAGLRSVETPVGRVSALICWEHWMPLPRQVMHDSGEDIHVAVWPTVHEMHQVASRHYAFEGRCFVLACGLIQRAGDLPKELALPDELAQAPETLVMRGGSAIIGPDGMYVAGPVFDEESVLTAEIDLAAVDREAMNLDVTGHYARRELLDVVLTPVQRVATEAP